MSASSESSRAMEGRYWSIEALRERHQVRPLEPREEGYAIAALPPGVYGYAYAPAQDEIPVFSKKAYHSFEVHKAGDGSEYLIGFVTPAEAQDLERGRQGASIRLFPEAWEAAQTLVSVPFTLMGTGRKSPREDGNPILFTLA